MFILLFGMASLHAQAAEEEPPPQEPAKQAAAGEKPAGDEPANPEELMNKLELPGITINAKERYIDVESEVCLDGGGLECVATVPDAKEHESIVKVLADPLHMHLALLLIGAQPGSPATQREVGEGEEKRWVFVPAHGQPIDVSLVVMDAFGEMVEKPIAHFIRHSEDEAAFLEGEEGEKKKEFPTSRFLFLGSHLIEQGEDQPRRYIAKESGNVISISTFGDEMIGLSERFGHDNEALVWEIDTDTLPKLGTFVTLRLRPVFE
ncbi:MAG: YdjY domain-containing protein [Akkermansiaceae bacterium]|nr:YdjY domain-containing protein [Akkermansiaceae bacterium]